MIVRLVVVTSHDNRNYYGILREFLVKRLNAGPNFVKYSISRVEYEFLL